tara:strand:- start:121640 stop:122116 length:477 start_codon:yes stop_codon:yes gene_type:complete
MDEFVAFFWEIDFWHWWAFAVALIVIEVFATSTLLLWPGISAAILGLVVLIRPDFDWRYQMLLFAVLSVISTVLWLRWLRMRPIESDHPTLNTRGRSYVGRRITLSEPLNDGRGRVRIDDTWWQVSADSALDKGVEIEVTDTDGATLIVRPFSAPKTA